jgi:hypothetical protein
MQLYLMNQVRSAMLAHGIVTRYYNNHMSSRLVVCKSSGRDVLDLKMESGSFGAGYYLLCSKYLTRLEKCNCT